MIPCDNCGFLNENSANFCGACGKPLDYYLFQPNGYMNGYNAATYRYRIYKSLDAIRNIISSLASGCKANISSISHDDPLYPDAPKCDIECLLYVNESFASKGWAVQIYVEDIGSSCIVTLIALGYSTMQVHVNRQSDFYPLIENFSFAESKNKALGFMHRFQAQY